MDIGPNPFEIAGSCDEEAAAQVMRAVGLAMQRYYGCDDWLTARDKDRPALRRIDHRPPAREFQA